MNNAPIPPQKHPHPQDIQSPVLTPMAMQGKNRQKAKVKFQILDTTHRTTNNHDKHIARCPKKQRQSGNENWPADRAQHTKHSLQGSCKKLGKG